MKHTNSSYRKTALWLVILLSALALSCLLWIRFIASDISSDRQLIADIYQDGELLQSIPLNTVEEAYTFTVVSKNGGQNEIRVCPGSIGIVSADCPDKLCVKQGFISSSLLPITCLPNHLVIQLRTEETDLNAEPSADMISY